MNKTVSRQPKSLTSSLIDAILNAGGLPIVLRSQRSLTMVNSYLKELEAKCAQQARAIEEKDKLIDEMSDITTTLSSALRERGVQIQFGPIVQGKVTWTLEEHAERP